MPIRPVPRKISELGSGTVPVVDDEVVKQVGEVPQAAPATWSPKSLTTVVVAAPVRSNVRELAVTLPVVSKQRLSAFIPPQVPEEKPDKLMPRPVSPVPEKPTVGPPSRMVYPDTASMVTQMSPVAQLPPVVTVAFATKVLPTKRLYVVAEAVDVIAKAAAMSDARSENLKLRLMVGTNVPLSPGEDFAPSFPGHPA